MDKIKDILVPLFADCQCSPDPLTPAHASISASPLRDPSVDHHRPNLPFCAIIRRFYTRLRQESEVIGCRIALEPSDQLRSQFMIQRPSHLLQKARFQAFHRLLEPAMSQLRPAMGGIKQIFEPFRQFATPAGQIFALLHGQETNLLNQMGQAVLHPNVKQADKLAIGVPLVSTDDLQKIFTHHVFQYPPAASRIDLEQTVIRCIKTPRPVQFAVIMMAGFVDVHLRLIGKTVGRFLIRRPQGIRYFPGGLAKQPPREVQLHRFFENLLNHRIRHMTGTLQKGHGRGQIRSQQDVLADYLRQGGNLDTACPQVPVFSGSMFDRLVHFFRQVYLLNHVPFIQRFKTLGIRSLEFVFNHVIDSVR